MEQSTATTSQDDRIPGQCPTSQSLVGICKPVQEQTGRFFHILLTGEFSPSAFKYSCSNCPPHPLRRKNRSILDSFKVIGSETVFKIGNHRLNSQRNAASQTVIHFPARIDCQKISSETANINHQGSAITNIGMLVMLPIFGQKHIHQSANRFIEGVGIDHFEIGFAFTHLNFPIANHRLHQIFPEFHISRGMAAKHSHFSPPAIQLGQSNCSQNTIVISGVSGSS